MTATANNNIRQAVPFLMVTDMDASLRFYVEGLGFTTTLQWTPSGRIEWCWLQRDGVAIMLQEYTSETRLLENARPTGFSIYFICHDAMILYDEFLKKGLSPREPFVGNKMWVVSLKDPDGYELHFESATDVPEGTTYSQ